MHLDWFDKSDFQWLSSVAIAVILTYREQIRKRINAYRYRGKRRKSSE